MNSLLNVNPSLALRTALQSPERGTLNLSPQEPV